MDQRIDSTTSSNTHSISESELISFLIGSAVDNQYSVAVWRLPGESTNHLIISRQLIKLNTDDALEDLATGFIFAPFDPSADRTYLKADLSFSFQNKEMCPPSTPLEHSSAEWLRIELDAKVERHVSPYTSNYIPPLSRKTTFVDTIATAVEQIQSGAFEKIVPSRAVLVDLSSSFDIIKTFHELCEANPNALISFVSTPNHGTWLGATPELLACVEEGRIFKTIALAGTQAYTGQNLKTVAWTQKDIEEQALVERYIISCFKKIRLREYEEHGPKTVVAGNLLHLRSEFKVDMHATNFPQLGSVMLKLLHPTSAVCGTPLEPSLEFLKRYEGYDRQFYAGYLGPVNFNNSTHVFVNLRCAQLIGNQAIVYAGAGVTIDSTPEQEWVETEMKMNTLRSVLTKSI